MDEQQERVGHEDATAHDADVRGGSSGSGTRAGTPAGMPGDGAGRREDVGGSGVYPASGPEPAGDAPYRTQAGWGQGDRGAAGYEDSGTSEVIPTDEEG